MQFHLGDNGRLVLRDGNAELAEYVYEPDAPQLESPRPYLLLRTRAGHEVTAYRPDDHVWHKGLSLALPVVGEHNFWGGPTYVRGVGYVQLSNNGAQVHRGFSASGTPVADAVAGIARFDERLDWTTEQGALLLAEERTITARRLAGDVWALTWHSVLKNVTTDAVAFGSPATRGRDDAGYAGIFWRGPEAFTGGAIVGPGGDVGDAARGRPAPWLAFIAPDESAAVVMIEAGPAASSWFARSAEYAGLGPAPFFFDEAIVLPGGVVQLGAVVMIGDPAVVGLAASDGAALAAELRDEHSIGEPADRPDGEGCAGVAFAEPAAGVVS